MNNVVADSLSRSMVVGLGEQEEYDAPFVVRHLGDWFENEPDVEEAEDEQEAQESRRLERSEQRVSIHRRLLILLRVDGMESSREVQRYGLNRTTTVRRGKESSEDA